MSPKGSSSTGPCSTFPIRKLTTRMILEKLMSNRCCTANHRYIQLTIRRRALQRHPTRTSKTSNYVRCWLHHCVPKYQEKLDAESVQKREANAQRTQAYHSRRESLRSSSSRDLEDAVFSFHSESGQNTFSKRDRSNESGNRFESCVHSVFRIADPAKVGKSLLDGNKDHLLYQARSELVKQECQVGSLNNCIDELQTQACAHRLELEDAITDTLNLDENKLGYKNYL